MGGDEKGGTLTPEAISKALDSLWNRDRERRRPDRFTGLRSVLGGGMSPLACGAALFAPDESLVNAVRAELILAGTPVHPLEAAWLNAPVQGPAPASCAREPHPDSPWHWDGRGTWWR
jgi:hypothetical protein